MASFLSLVFSLKVDDKYQYSRENKDNKVHGWIAYHGNTSTGFWMITPSNEFRAGGPFKQELTSHTGPVTLNVSPTPLAQYEQDPFQNNKCKKEF